MKLGCLGIIAYTVGLSYPMKISWTLCLARQSTLGRPVYIHIFLCPLELFGSSPVLDLGVRRIQRFHLFCLAHNSYPSRIRIQTMPKINHGHAYPDQKRVGFEEIVRIKKLILNT
jgi:hypothetical protein